MGQVFQLIWNWMYEMTRAHGRQSDNIPGTNHYIQDQTLNSQALHTLLDADDETWNARQVHIALSGQSHVNTDEQKSA